RRPRLRPCARAPAPRTASRRGASGRRGRSEEHTSELQSRRDLVCRLLLEKKKSLGRPAHTSLPGISLVILVLPLVAVGLSGSIGGGVLSAAPERRPVQIGGERTLGCHAGH